jgi:hypothetical protein
VGYPDDFDNARALAVGPDGTGVYVVGFSAGLSTSFDYASAAFAS